MSASISGSETWSNPSSNCWRGCCSRADCPPPLSVLARCGPCANWCATATAVAKALARERRCLRWLILKMHLPGPQQLRSDAAPKWLLSQNAKLTAAQRLIARQRLDQIGAIARKILIYAWSVCRRHQPFHWPDQPVPEPATPGCWSYSIGSGGDMTASLYGRRCLRASFRSRTPKRGPVLGSVKAARRSCIHPEAALVRE